MLKIWGRRNSFNVQKVMWLVGELGIAHDHIPAGGDFGGLDTPEFLALNPHGRVPVIDDAGVNVWESHTILHYLAARFGAGSTVNLSSTGNSVSTGFCRCPAFASRSGRR